MDELYTKYHRKVQKHKVDISKLPDSSSDLMSLFKHELILEEESLF
jgi:hypothetical protein